jgi:hypothetical protein
VVRATKLGGSPGRRTSSTAGTDGCWRAGPLDQLAMARRTQRSNPELTLTKPLNYRSVTAQFRQDQHWEVATGQVEDGDG